MNSSKAHQSDKHAGASASDLSVWEQLLLDMIRIPSLSGDEQHVAVTLEQRLKALFPEADVERQVVSEDRWNIIMSKGTPQVTLTTHIDTVPGGSEPTYTAERMYGRGACDAKGQVAAQLWGLELAIAKGLRDYRCAFVVGEETDAIGAQMLLALPTTPYILNGEPTGNRFVRRSWGCLELEVFASGVSAHSSLGTDHSAIHTLIADVANLLQDLPEGVSLNVGTIKGGVASNVQAPFASCDICARIRGETAPLLELLSQRLTKVKWRPKFAATPGLELFVPERYADSDLEVRFASDCSVYAGQYERIMLFGPGHIQDAHTENESVSRTELEVAANCICSVLLDLSTRDHIDSGP